MNYDRLIALYHVCIAWHGGQDSSLYRLQSRIFPDLIQPRGDDEYLVTLDTDGYEEARALYGKYVLALTPCRDESTYLSCSCDGCEGGDNIMGQEWERGLLRCDDCRENGCGHRGCDCPREEEEEEEEDTES